MADPTKAELQEALDAANARIAELEASERGLIAAVKELQEQAATGSAPGPDVIAGAKSLLRLIPDAKRFQTGYLSANDWKKVGAAAEFLKQLVSDAQAEG